MSRAHKPGQWLALLTPRGGKADYFHWGQVQTKVKPCLTLPIWGPMKTKTFKCCFRCQTTEFWCELKTFSTWSKILKDNLVVEILLIHLKIWKRRTHRVHPGPIILRLKLRVFHIMKYNEYNYQKIYLTVWIALYETALRLQHLLHICFQLTHMEII